jgi:hypothetical protein
MTDRPTDPGAAKEVAASGRADAARRREDRRKAALKANMARRKAQMRGRDTTTDLPTDCQAHPGTGTTNE